MTLGERIVYFRTKKGLSQRDLAERLDVTPGAVGHWERRSIPGRAAPPVPRDMEALVRALGVSMAQFWSGSISTRRRAA